jgi:hypothetical protein
MYSDRSESDYFYESNHRSLLNTAGDTVAELAWSRRGLPLYMDVQTDEDIIDRDQYTHL